MKSWVVCIDRSEMVIHEWNSKGKILEVISRIAHPEGRLKSGELLTDRPGRSTGPHHAERDTYSPTSEAKESELLKFTRKIADLLESASYQNKFDQLVLIAEPHTLGVMRRELGPHAREKLTESVHHELTRLDSRQLKTYLEARDML